MCTAVFIKMLITTVYDSEELANTSMSINTYMNYKAGQ